MIRFTIAIMISILVLISCGRERDMELQVASSTQQDAEIDRLNEIVHQLEIKNKQLSEELSIRETKEQDYRKEQTANNDADAYTSIGGLYRLGDIDSERGMRVLDLERYFAFQEVIISENGLSVDSFAQRQIRFINKNNLNDRISINFESYPFDEPFFPDFVSHEINLEGNDITSWRVSRGMGQYSEIPYEKISDDSFHVPVVIDSTKEVNKVVGLYASSSDTNGFGLQVFRYQDGLIFQRVRLNRPTETEYLNLFENEMIPAAFSPVSQTGIYRFSWQISRLGYVNEATVWQETYELEVHSDGLFGFKIIDENREILMPVDLVKISGDPFNIPN